MAVTTSYALQNIKTEFISNYSANTGTNSNEFNPAVIALADGGYAVAYTWQSVTTPGETEMLLERYTADGVFRPSPNGGVQNATLLDVFQSGAGLADPSITQLAGGGISGDMDQGPRHRSRASISPSSIPPPAS